jgi:hypothetical protein
MSNLGFGGDLDKDGEPKEGFDERVRRIIREVLSDPLGFPEEYKGWLPEWLALSGFNIPISQVRGFAQFTANSASVTTQQSTASASYTNLGTVGPELAGLPAGSYLLIYGAGAAAVAGVRASVSPKINAVEATDADAMQLIPATAGDVIPGAMATVKTLSEASNTVTLRYKVASGTASFQNRWLVALKYSNA